MTSLKKKMIILGKKERFDEAIKIRDKLDAIKKIFRNSQIIDKRINDEDHNSKLETIAKFFGLTSAVRIEGYDISNIQGINAVGSMVTFKNGLADKSGYRKFKIRDSNVSDDTRMLKEILTRRFRHSEWAKPNLVIIDGGKGQLNIASSIVPKDIALLSLTKNEKHVGSHIYIRGRKLPIKLDKLPADVRNIVLNVDAEAHRFAISYYRKLHRNMTTP
ncbi:MAG: UvrABC system protein C [Candidatus Yanofskybacteria bacterium GW2011_GWF2_43_596]|nr:MAG: UvrABC system protein C [Candidatus Yanofskybacteria bacterium GW2011_GWF2_43_596]